LGIAGYRGEFPRVPNPTGNSFPSPKGYGSYPTPTSMQPYWPMMGQPYQGGKLVTTLGWGWPSMMPGDNVATPVMTMVEASRESPLDVNEGSFRPSNKGQRKGPSHSTKARK